MEQQHGQPERVVYSPLSIAVKASGAVATLAAVGLLWAALLFAGTGFVLGRSQDVSVGAGLFLYALAALLWVAIVFLMDRGAGHG